MRFHEAALYHSTRSVFIGMCVGFFVDYCLNVCFPTLSFFPCSLCWDMFTHEFNDLNNNCKGLRLLMYFQNLKAIGRTSNQSKVKESLVLLDAQVKQPHVVQCKSPCIKHCCTLKKLIRLFFFPLVYQRCSVFLLRYQTASYLFKSFRLNLFIEVVIESLGL